MQSITVRVPASTSNLGPGFDCLGLALRVYNDVTLRRGRGGRAAEMCATAAEAFFKFARVQPFQFSCTIHGDVPISRGLGSSVTVRLGTLIGLNELSGRTLKRAEMFRICAALEGHPDNAAPGAFGGFNVVAGDAVQTFRVSPKLRVILLVPNVEIETDKARRVLPRSIEHRTAVMNGANVARIVAAFASSSYEQMRGAFTDYLHQSFRKQLVPHFDKIVAAADAAGALGTFLSGSGSTIAALALDQVNEIARAMRDAAADGKAKTIVTCADNRGAQVIR